MRVVAGFVVFLAVGSPAGFGQQRPVAPEDAYRILSVGGPVLSPAGDHVAFTVTRVLEKENKRQTTIWLQPLRNGQPTGEPIPFTDPTRDSESPRWSPDGTLLSFQSRRGEERNRTWFLRVVAPGGEAFRIDGVEGAPIWSEDGRSIAFVRRPGEDEDEDEEEGQGRRRRREGWVSPEAITQTLDTARFDGRVITHLRYKRDGTFTPLPHPSVQRKAQLHVVPAEGGEARQVTELDWSARQAVWAPDGRTLVFTGDEHEDDEVHFDPSVKLWAVPAAGGEVRRLSAGPGSFTAPAFSPDGRMLAFLHVAAQRAPTRLMAVEVAPDGTFRGEPRDLTAGWDRTPGAPAWSADGRHVRFTAADGGEAHVFEVPVRGGPVRPVTTGARRVAAVTFSRDGRLMAYAATDVVSPAEVFVARTDGTRERRLTTFNDEWLASVERQPARRLTWTVADGTEIEGWLIEPVGYDPARRYPLILSIHGGPHAAYGHSFSPMFHVLSGAGFFVLYANPRGSTGYGHAFTYAIDGGWGAIDEEDLLTGVDAALAANPAIDPGRLGVTGGSYGGFMTNWLTARTDRFAAAVTRASVANWIADYGTTDSWRSLEVEFFGPPWEQRDLYRKLSPIEYVENVTTPTLIVHGDNDIRTPLNHAEEWYFSLRRREVPVEYVRYPRTAHAIREPVFVVDNLERTRGWFVHWLIERPGDGARPVSDGR